MTKIPTINFQRMLDEKIKIYLLTSHSETDILYFQMKLNEIKYKYVDTNIQNYITHCSSLIKDIQIGNLIKTTPSNNDLTLINLRLRQSVNFEERFEKKYVDYLLCKLETYKYFKEMDNQHPTINNNANNREFMIDLILFLEPSCFGFEEYIVNMNELDLR